MSGDQVNCRAGNFHHLLKYFHSFLGGLRSTGCEHRMHAAELNQLLQGMDWIPCLVNGFVERHRQARVAAQLEKCSFIQLTELSMKLVRRDDKSTSSFR